MRAARARGGGEIVPVDSEHSALYQALRGGTARRGRAARCSRRAAGRSAAALATELAHVTVEDALKHPTWDMGAKITIDSSTLMNKGLEVIEAHELFDVDYDQVGVVVHPQSVVHGMVEFCDGAVIAQLSMPDMRLPIGLALGAPDRLDGAVRGDRLGDARLAHLRAARSRGLSRACRWRTRRGAPAAGRRRLLSGANEIAVEAFLERRIPWLAIADVNGGVLSDETWGRPGAGTSGTWTTFSKPTGSRASASSPGGRPDLRHAREP